MELRHYLDMLKRHKWLIVESVIIVGLLAGVFSSLKTPVYRATARVLLQPNDPAEQINSTNSNSALAPPSGSDADRFVSAQEDIVLSPDVVNAAAASLSHLSAGTVKRERSVTQEGQSNVLDVSATDSDPGLARDIANGVATAYIANRQQDEVAGLHRAADQIGTELTQLETRIAQLDQKIGDGSGPVPGASTAPSQPVAPGAKGLAQPASQLPGGDLTLGGTPTTTQSLQAARYAAAVQYETLYQQQQTLLVDITLKHGEAELITAAALPGSPVSPKPRRDGLFGAVVGLLLGVGLAFGREQLDDRFHTTADVERVTGLPVLAELPYDEESERAPDEVAVIGRPLSATAEAVRSLRTSLQFLSVDRPLQVIVVTSPGVGDGKSFVAANLAAAYARAGYSTVLLGADLRKPRLQAMVGVGDRSVGLTEVIAGLSDDQSSQPAHSSTMTSVRSVKHVLIDTPLAKLKLVPPGLTPPNPAELLGSRRMSEVLAELREIAEVVVIDSPPLLAVTDAAVLAGQADGVVFVTALSVTHRQAAERAKAILEGTGCRVLGVAINRIPRGGTRYYGRYYVYQGEPPLGRRRRRRPVHREVVAGSRGDGPPLSDFESPAPSTAGSNGRPPPRGAPRTSGPIEAGSEETKPAPPRAPRRRATPVGTASSQVTTPLEDGDGPPDQRERPSQQR